MPAVSDLDMDLEQEGYWFIMWDLIWDMASCLYIYLMISESNLLPLDSLG